MPGRNVGNETLNIKMDCVANTVYYEARGEGEDGMRAVAHVIYNRAKKSGQPPCIVVKKPKQFASGPKPKDGKLWNKAKRIANNPGPDLTRGATFFHNLTVKPYWSYKFKITLRLGNHIFYKNH